MILTTVIYFWGFKRKLKKPEKIFSNEAILFLGVLATTGLVFTFGKGFNIGRISALLLISYIIYGILGFFAKSNLIWLFSLISLGSCFGAETGYISGWGAYYLGMNYPLRFVLFGGFLTAISLVLEHNKNFIHFYKTTLSIGLLYLFIAAWILSIFGNYGDLSSWAKVSQIELFHWALIFGLLSGDAIYHGLKYDNGITKNFGVTFLFINLYTRFFEYFWDITNKIIFFIMLAISFWVIGSKAEKIWGANKK